MEDDRTIVFVYEGRSYPISIDRFAEISDEFRIHFERWRQALAEAGFEHGEFRVDSESETPGVVTPQEFFGSFWRLGVAVPAGQDLLETFRKLSPELASRIDSKSLEVVFDQLCWEALERGLIEW